MRKEEFAEVLGDISEKHIVDARADRKAQKPVWLKWGAIAACLCLVVVGAFVAPTLVGQTPNGDIESPPPVADAAPMVCVNDILYKQSTSQTAYAELKEEFVYLGEIESEVINDQSISDGIPNKDFQANHPIVGSKVYQFGDDIVVEINGKYWLYENFMID